MTHINDIGAAFAQRLADGAATQRDATGASVALEVPLSEGNTAELGVNPHSGFFIRLRSRMDHLSEPERETLGTDLVRLTASSRFRSGWIGGCEDENIFTLAVPLEPSSDGRSIASLIETASSFLRPGRVDQRQQMIGEGPPAGEDWLRV